MAYDPADLRLPAWLNSALETIIQLRLPVGPDWSFGVTRPGAVFAATMLSVTGAALLSGNNLLYLCAAMLLSMGLLALLSGIRLLRAVPDIHACMPDISTAGGVHVLRCPLTLHSRFAADVDLHWQGEGDANTVDLLLRCTSESLLLARLHVPRRGLFRFDRLWAGTEAPLGLWNLRRRVASQGWAWAVVPAPLELPLPLELSALDGGEWQDLRGYSHGDAPSRVHWRKSVGPSSSDWLVKRFGAETKHDQSGLLRVDLRSPAGPPFEKLLARAVGWMRRHPAGELVLGRRHFRLDDTQQSLQAWRSLAGATPESSPVAGHGGIVLRAEGGDAG